MTYPCKGPFKGHLTYTCYKNIKYQFGEKIEGTNFSIDENISKYAKIYTADNGPKLKNLSNIFTNLKKYLSNGHVFGSGDYNGEGTCKYISYLLCNQIREELHGECDNGTFNIFKEFVDKYNDSTNSKMCMNNIKHLDNREFLKMKALYDLYDKYIQLSSIYAHNHPNYCSDMINLVRLYNYFLNEYPSDSSNFNDVLKDFKELMVTIIETGKRYCIQEYFSIREPRLFISSVVQIPSHANTSSGRESNILQEGTLNSEVKPKFPEVTSSSTSVKEQEIEDLENSKRFLLSDLLEVEATSVSEDPLERSLLSKKLEHSGKQETFIRHKSYDSPGHNKTNETFPRGEDSMVVTKGLENGSGNYSTGFMTNVQNGISEFIKDIDPVPVMGVSGGMGALYLLLRVLKYF
ncbi:CYIR protein [Plasmodium cynomolgi strain B]|uniref:CYIR protein n=1 Tax=Plasmodium cynomolgi (strain B) TaxID=1120755 RepID=K6VJU4_PLACD|nr:CYIR protein [Plasmodium cynomolgi strain B]GAB69697.1 CYIR protein [Plasmodium cynomolgi strain B]